MLPASAPPDGVALVGADLGDTGTPPGSKTGARVARGLSERKADKVARNTKSWWRNSGLEISIALPVSHFDNLGVPRLAG